MQEKLYKLIIKILKLRQDKTQALKDKKYHKYSRHQALGIKAAILDKTLKDFKQLIEQLNCNQSLSLAEKLYKTRIEEHILAGTYVLQLHSECLGIRQIAYLDRCLDNFISWSTTDDFCIDILQPILLKYPKQTLNLLKNWNKSKNVWKRRASVVAFTRKIGESGKFTKETLRLCENLIWDKEDLVKKAVDWALKDASRGNQKTVLSYIKSLKKRGVSSIIISYALRDLNAKQRKEILNEK